MTFFLSDLLFCGTTTHLFHHLLCAGKIAPIFFNTMEDSGSLPIEMDVSKMAMGDVIDIMPYDGLHRVVGVFSSVRRVRFLICSADACGTAAALCGRQVHEPRDRRAARELLAQDARAV